MKNNCRNFIFFFVIFCNCPSAWALKPDQVLVVANGANHDSVRIAQYYCQKRSVPKGNILKLSLDQTLNDSISRADYRRLIAGPVRSRLFKPEFAGKITCLLTVYGVPFRVNARGMLKGQEKSLARLEEVAKLKTERLKKFVEQLNSLAQAVNKNPNNSDKKLSAKEILNKLDSYIGNARNSILGMQDEYARQRRLKKWLQLNAEIYGKGQTWQKAQAKAALFEPMTAAEKIERLDCETLFKKAKNENWDYSRKLQDGFYPAIETFAGLRGLLLRLDADINDIKGIETNASVDSELSTVMFDDYLLYRWRKNELKKRSFILGARTLMVARLDGPGADIATGLVDKAISAERTGLKGTAYIDSGYSQVKNSLQFKQYDQALLDTALLIKQQSTINVIQEKTARLFCPGSCPGTALYCGWYSLRKYVDAFDFVDGAVGFHIASLEAVNLRDAAGTQWCPAMLTDGITATIGAVAEPYLAAFPEPKRFFSELIRGRTLVEAYYRAKPYNSWQMVLIGDPLYRPFKPY